MYIVLLLKLFSSWRFENDPTSGVRANKRARKTTLTAFFSANITPTYLNRVSPRPSRLDNLAVCKAREIGRRDARGPRAKFTALFKSSGDNVCVRTDNNSSRNDITAHGTRFPHTNRTVRNLFRFITGELSSRLWTSYLLGPTFFPQTRVRRNADRLKRPPERFLYVRNGATVCADF